MTTTSPGTAQPAAPRPAPHAAAHPIAFLVLYLPFGIPVGYVVVTLAYLLSQAGVSVDQVAGLGPAGMLFTEALIAIVAAAFFTAVAVLARPRPAAAGYASRAAQS